MNPEADDPHANWLDDPSGGVGNPHAEKYKRERLTLHIGVDVDKRVLSVGVSCDVCGVHRGL